MFRYIQFVHVCQLQKSRGSRMAESGAVLAEDLFAASLAADSDRWLAFHIDPNQPTQQLGQDLLQWLDQNKPSVVTR